MIIASISFACCIYDCLCFVAQADKLVKTIKEHLDEKQQQQQHHLADTAASSGGDCGDQAEVEVNSHVLSYH